MHTNVHDHTIAFRCACAGVCSSRSFQPFFQKKGEISYRLCTFAWRLSSSDLANFLLQFGCLHAKGRSPV